MNSDSASSTSSCFHWGVLAVFVGFVLWAALRGGAPQTPHMPGVTAVAPAQVEKVTEAAPPAEATAPAPAPTEAAPAAAASTTEDSGDWK